MEVLALSIMIGFLGLVMREVVVTREEEKRVKKLEEAEAKLMAELHRTNAAVIASFKA